MFRHILAGTVALVVFVGTLTAADKEVKSKLVSVDTAGKKVTVTVDGKNQEFGLATGVVVTIDGKESKDGLKDKALKAGAEVTLVIPERGRLVKTIEVEVAAAAAAKPKDKAADKTAAKPKDDKAKFEVRGTKAKITKIDMEKGVISILTEDGKKVELSVDDDTKFFGPRGGLSDKGTKDDRVAVGHEIHYLMSKDNKKVEEIHLPVRKSNDK
jgi:hypothetical protein